MGKGLFTFQSDAGIHLFNGFTKDGVKRGVKNYPTWGTVQLEKSSHAIREFIEYLRVPERGMLAGLFTSGFRAGEHSWLREFGYVDVGEKSYWLPKREEINVYLLRPEARSSARGSNLRELPAVRGRFLLFSYGQIRRCLSAGF